MTIRQIRRLLPFWQDVLNLREWKISVRFGTSTEMTENVGLNYYSVEELQSQILLARGEGEETLIHELLHLVFDGHKPDGGPYDPLHERALNRTAAALTKLSALMRENNASI
jgi:hypothetical protein